MLRLSCTRGRQQIRSDAIFRTFLASYSDPNEDRKALSSSSSAGGANFNYRTQNTTKTFEFPISSKFPLTTFQLSGRRNFSSSASSSNVVETPQTGQAAESGEDSENVDAAIDRLFAENQELINGVAASEWEPTWYNVADQAVVSIKYLHDVTGWGYGLSIVGATCILRLSLFPIMVMSQQTSSRMAHVNPEMKQLQAKFEQIEKPTTQDRARFSKQMKDLFARYGVKPMRAFIAPIFQLPLFMGMFFGLQKMGKIYPEEFSTEGFLWFTDLTVGDPYYILPALTTASLLLLTEISKDQMTVPGQSNEGMVLFMRVMAIVMFPVMMNFDSSLCCYWTVNNMLSVVQTKLLTTKSVRKAFGIWDRPKPVPGQEAPSMMKQLENIAKRMRGEPLTEEARMKEHNRAIDTKRKAMSLMKQAKAKRKL